MDISQSQANQVAGDYGEQPLNKTTYVCGQCGKKNECCPSKQEIKCTQCTGRIFYKVRQRIPLQYEAR